MLASPPRFTEQVVPPRLYVERVVYTPQAAAEAAFDLMLELHAEGPTDSPRYRFSTTAGELVLLRPVRRPVYRTASAVYPVRVAGGWILSRTGMYRMRIEFELLRWSGRAAAFGLRPLTRHHPLGFGPYLRIGGEVMTGLRNETEAWARAGSLPA